MMMMKINREALFCDETEDYRSPYEPDTGDTVCFRLRTGRDNADSVFYLEPDTKVRRRMRRVFSEGRFDYYEITMELGEGPVPTALRSAWAVKSVITTAWGRRTGRMPPMPLRLSPVFTCRSG